MNPQYSIIIEWSDENDTFVVFLPEWIDRYAMPCGDGKTYDEALQSAKDALETFIQFANDDGIVLPSPRVYAHVT